MKHLAVNARFNTRSNQPVKFGLTKIIIFGSYFFQSWIRAHRILVRMEDNAVIMAMEHTTVHATVHTREKTAKKVRITFRTLNLLFSVETFGLLCTAWVWAWWHDIPHATRPGGTMAGDQIIILKLQQKISCCPQTDRIICLSDNNHSVVILITRFWVFSSKSAGSISSRTRPFGLACTCIWVRRTFSFFKTS